MPTTMDHALLAKAVHPELDNAAQSQRPDNSGLSEHDVQVAAMILKDHTGMAASTPERGTQVPEAQECNGSTSCAQTHLSGAGLPAATLPPSHSGIPANESMLSCAACHQTKDRHQGFLAMIAHSAMLQSSGPSRIFGIRRCAPPSVPNATSRRQATP